jgi:hypothetical protein
MILITLPILSRKTALVHLALGAFLFQVMLQQQLMQQMQITQQLQVQLVAQESYLKAYQ